MGPYPGILAGRPAADLKPASGTCD